MYHKDSALGNQHIIHNWAVTDNTARDALAVGPADVGKVCLVGGTTLFWLQDDSPLTWTAVGGGGGGGGAIIVKEEGSTLTSALASMNFVGAGATATTVGDDVTVTIPAQDHLATLAAAEIALTTTATLTASRTHVASGTTADYTVTLPAASGNAGKFVTLRIAATCTRWITLKGNAAELIDGVNTRKMWAGENATVMCDGTGWTKIAGITIPLSAVMRRITAQSVTNNTWVQIVMTSVVRDNSSAMAVPLADLTNGRCAIPRSNDYSAIGFVSIEGLTTSTGSAGGAALNNPQPADNPNAFCSSPANLTGDAQYAGSGIFAASAGDYICATILQSSTGAKNTRALSTVYPTLTVRELPKW